MKIFYVFLVVVIVFEYVINPFGFFGLYEPKAEYYLAFSLGVSIFILILTIYSFLRLRNLIIQHRNDISDNVTSDLYNSIGPLFAINLCNIAQTYCYISDTKSSNLVAKVLFPYYSDEKDSIG